MRNKQPYIHWDLDFLFEKLLKQEFIYKYGYSKTDLENMVHSKRWNPLKEFNGCNVVQDDLHPFLPCFVHDYRWIAEGRTNKADKEFRNNLLKFGYSTVKATMYYFAVRVGSVYYKIFK